MYNTADIRADIYAPTPESSSMRTLLDKPFFDRDPLLSGRLGRWLVVICSLALGADQTGKMQALYGAPYP